MPAGSDPTRIVDAISTALGPATGPDEYLSVAAELVARVTRHSDLTDRDLELVRALQPLLAVLDQLSIEPSAPKSTPDPCLTARETEILELLARGLTADSVGRALLISRRTVSKHLENAYAKLGCHDRLMATRKAEALGLIEARPP